MFRAPRTTHLLYKHSTRGFFRRSPPAECQEASDRSRESIFSELIESKEETPVEKIVTKTSSNDINYLDMSDPANIGNAFS